MPVEGVRKTGAFNSYGFDECESYLDGITDRLANLGGWIDDMWGILEASEQALFERMSPYGVMTGRTKASLVGETSDSIRVTDPGIGMAFGTKVWYAKFLRKIGGPSGVPRGRKRIGPNLVLHITTEDRLTAAAALADFVMLR